MAAALIMAGSVRDRGRLKDVPASLSPPQALGSLAALGAEIDDLRFHVAEADFTLRRSLLRPGELSWKKK
jgi:hypothetical protein